MDKIYFFSFFGKGCGDPRDKILPLWSYHLKIFFDTVYQRDCIVLVFLYSNVNLQVVAVLCATKKIK